MWTGTRPIGAGNHQSAFDRVIPLSWCKMQTAHLETAVEYQHLIAVLLSTNDVF